MKPTRRVAMGDPQASLQSVFAVLDANGLRDGQGRLRDDVHLVSMGDHFDWGPPSERAKATADALTLLEWLASHSAEQVTILLGNHDAARVGELAAFDDATFAKARAEADAEYFDGARRVAETEFRSTYDQPSFEIIARDFSTFCVAQRVVVEKLLRAGRFRLALAEGDDLLLTHAGVSHDQLDALSIPAASRAEAPRVADALNHALQDAIDAWRFGPLVLAGLHTPGNAQDEGAGMLFHRPALDVPLKTSPATQLRRRFHPTALPLGLSQAIGHIRDKKCRELLGAMDTSPEDGPLRTLRVVDGRPVYQRGVAAGDPREATMIFLDGGMAHAPPERYQLLDLGSRRVFRG